jgi:poly(3-hydroxyalkanoate) depolymerase
MSRGVVDDVSVRWVDVSGHRIRVAVRPGDGTGAPLLMCSGLGGRLELLAPLARSLRGIETITFDVPGVGESPAPCHPYSLPMLASLTGCVLDQLGYDDVDLFGFSWGGALAQQFAIQSPSRCRRLILAATMPGTPMVPGAPGVLIELATPRRFNDPDHLRRIAGDLYGGRARTEPVLADASVQPTEHPAGSFGYWLQLAAIAGWSSHLWLAAVRQPTLILAGDDDPIIPLANAHWMASLLPNSRLHVLSDGHYFIRTSVEETSRVIREFLEP